jgi:hypothetical protein
MSDRGERTNVAWSESGQVFFEMFVILYDYVNDLFLFVKESVIFEREGKDICIAVLDYIVNGPDRGASELLLTDHITPPARIPRGKVITQRGACRIELLDSSFFDAA